MVGLFVVALIGISTIIDLWELLDWNKRHISNEQLWFHLFARTLCLILIPLFIYMGSFYLHLSVLHKTGPGDAFMSPEFQSTLDGNEMNEKSEIVYYGSNVTILSRPEKIYLHSHPHNYPLHHLIDSKVSSQGQQVTGYPVEDDPNNLWTILPGYESLESVLPKKKPVRNNDIIRLYHPMTNSFLLTHDVASALTMTNMEVTTLNTNDPKYNERIPETMWEIDFVSNGSKLTSKSMVFKLFHMERKVFLCNHMKNYPEWGFGQREINGVRSIDDNSNHWTISSLWLPFGNELNYFINIFIEQKLTHLKHSRRNPGLLLVLLINLWSYKKE